MPTRRARSVRFICKRSIIERLLEQHVPDQDTVALSPTDDVFLRSYTWARFQLRIPLAPD
jgi:hypothetical protein